MRSRTAKLHIPVVSACAALGVSLLLGGCGGGGGGSSVSRGDLSVPTTHSSTDIPIGAGPTTPETPVAPTTRSLKLNTYGGWGTGCNADSASVLTDRFNIFSKNDNICFGEGGEWPNDVPGWPGLTPSAIKAVNPTAKIYRYFTLLWKNKNDSDWNNPSNTSRMWSPLTQQQIDSNNWWLRDGNGTIIKDANGAPANYLDVGKTGFKEAYTKQCVDRLAGKGFDGVVLDIWYDDISVSWLSPNWFATHPMPTAYPTGNDWFEKAWKPFITSVIDGLHAAGYRVIGNCAGEFDTDSPNQMWQRSKLDGIVYEQFIIDWDGSWLSESRVAGRINSIANDPLEAWAVEAGLKKTDPNYSQKMRASLAAYYVAVPASGPARSYKICGDAELYYWEPTYDFKIGTPIGTATKNADSYFWSRKYTYGLVLFNYESSRTIDYTLDRNYQDSTGQAQSGTIHVPPRTGIIMKYATP